MKLITEPTRLARKGGTQPAVPYASSRLVLLAVSLMHGRTLN